MATVLPPPATIEYPTTDFKPMAETEIHLDLLFDSREVVSGWYEALSR
jgi:hypothetical protein